MITPKEMLLIYRLIAISESHATKRYLGGYAVSRGACGDGNGEWIDVEYQGRVILLLRVPDKRSDAYDLQRTLPPTTHMLMSALHPRNELPQQDTLWGSKENHPSMPSVATLKKRSA